MSGGSEVTADGAAGAASGLNVVGSAAAAIDASSTETGGSAAPAIHAGLTGAGGPAAAAIDSTAHPSERMRIAKAYEAALFAGRMEEVASYFTDDVVYWVAGEPPIGGIWRGREAVLRAFDKREPGLGAADWGYEDLERSWYDAENRVIVELREKSWLRSSPEDVMDQRTCVVIEFRGDRICSMRDYTDAGVYAAFAVRHKSELPKFRDR